MKQPSAPYEVEPLGDVSDQRLVDLVRAGDSRAYATLWRRHSGSAYGVARTFLHLDADDLVSEAFTKVLGAIRAGGGPARAFRPYITMTVRNIGRSLHVREAVLVDADLQWRGTYVANGEVAAVEDFERCATWGAFDSLPVRWQEVLWYSEVDGLKVGTIAVYLGIPANAVSALLLRAKRALRDAWISAQLAAATSPECEATIRDLGAYTRRRLSHRAAAAVEAHLDACANCRAAHIEARRVSSLLLGLLPIVAGVAGAAGYAAQLAAPPVPQALVALSASSVPDAVAVGFAASASAAPAALSALSMPVAAGAAGAAGAGATAAAAALSIPVSSGATGLVGSATTAVLSVVTAVVLSLGPVTDVIEAAHGHPVVSSSLAAPEPPPAPTTAPLTNVLVSPPAAVTTPPPATELPASPTEPVPLPGAGAADAPQILTTRIAAEPGTPPDGEMLPSPDAALTQSDARMYPRVSGDDAHPGATIELVDENDRVVGSGTADERGAWAAEVSEGTSGRHTLRALQTIGEQTSAPSSEMPYETDAAPVINSPAEGEQVDASSLTLVLSAEAGAVVHREIVGTVPSETLQVPESGVWQETLTVLPGPQTVRVRYADPETGEVGPFAEVTVDAH